MQRPLGPWSTEYLWTDGTTSFMGWDDIKYVVYSHGRPVMNNVLFT